MIDTTTLCCVQALSLLQRLAAPHLDPAAQLPIRQQVKMIARIANPVDWHKSGKLSRTELRLLESYNAKPVRSKCRTFVLTTVHICSVHDVAQCSALRTDVL